MDIRKLVRSRTKETYDLHRKFVNPQFVRVLEVIGYNRNYISGHGPYLVDEKGTEVLDFLSGFGVFNIGRNHPVVKQALKDMIDADTASLPQMDVTAISGVLAEELVSIAPEGLDAVFFTNSGTESVEGAIKFARQATGRTKVVSLDHAFHGLTLGSLSVMGAPEFRNRNEPLLPNCVRVPVGDLDALEDQLKHRQAAAFIAEPVQGKSLHVPNERYFNEVRQLCDKYGTLFIADEVQSGFGRTGKMFAIEHWGVSPDIMCVSKALSGGLVPVGAILTRRDIHSKIFDSMDRCFAHSNTFGQGELAMAAGLATLHVLKEEKIPEHAEQMGKRIRAGLEKFAAKYEMLHGVRGLGLMLGLKFGKPKSLKLKAGWNLLHKMNEDLFCQMITMPLLEKHDILTQVAGHGLDTVKLLPTLVIGERECDMFLDALDEVLEDAHRIPGAAWKTTKNLALRTAKVS